MSDNAVFEEWANRFDHDSREWEDMGRDAVFIAGMNAARSSPTPGGTRNMPEGPAFNGLSYAEAERLAILMEELAEAQQVIGKILRHGYESTHPDGGPTNRQALEKELGDVRNAERMMIEANDLAPHQIQQRAHEKAQTIGQFLHHQVETPSHS